MQQLQYISANEAAEKWGISHRRVITLCKENRIPNCAMLGNMWIIPSEAEKPIDGRTTRCDKKNPAKPFIKWAGGKGQLLPTIRKFYPPKMGTEIKKYCEPMVGAGAVLFDILNTYEMDEVYICDTNSELMNTYTVVRDCPDRLISFLSAFEKDHLSYEDDDRKGLFNVPMGSYKKPTICDKENINKTSELLQGVTILVGDYKAVEKYVDGSTFVFVNETLCNRLEEDKDLFCDRISKANPFIRCGCLEMN